MSKKYNFCTLFNKKYLLYGLGLYHSLEKQNVNFHLYVVAFDDYTADMLQKLNLSNLTMITMKEFEDKKLLAVKPTRTISEYCWTCSSSVILYCLNNFKLESCAYVDADLFFFNSPKILDDELGSASISLSEHGYSAEKEKDVLLRGKYCVQYMRFRNDINGLEALRWWRERCLEWCFNRVENGKFGDQKYLDDWTERFQGVQVLRHLGGVASWNINRYDFSTENKILTGIDKNTRQKFPIVFYHFHNAKIFNIFGRVYVKGFTHKKDVLGLIYKPYSKNMTTALNLIKKIDPTFNDGFGSKKDFLFIMIKDLVPSKLKKSIKLYLMPKKHSKVGT